MDLKPRARGSHTTSVLTPRGGGIVGPHAAAASISTSTIRKTVCRIREVEESGVFCRTLESRRSARGAEATWVLLSTGRGDTEAAGDSETCLTGLMADETQDAAEIDGEDSFNEAGIPGEG